MDALSRSNKNPTAPTQAPGKQASLFSLMGTGYIIYRGAWRLFESSLWFELEDGSDYLTGYAKPGSRPIIGIPLAKATIIAPSKAKKARDSKENKRCKLTIKTESGKEHKLVLASEESRDEWIKALILARDLALSGAQLVKQWQDNGCGVCIGDPLEVESGTTAAEEILEPTPEASETVPASALTARLEDAQGKVTSLKQILVGKRPVVLVFVRHFGCVLCRLVLAKLRGVTPQLMRMGSSIIVIGTGTPEMARNFRKQFDFHGRIYVDQARALYSALGCRRGFRFALSPFAMMKAKEAYGLGYSQGPTLGDTWQLGGLFVVTSTAAILYSHNERYGGDPANLPEVVASVERHVRQTDTWTSLPEAVYQWPLANITSPAIVSSKEHFIEIATPSVPPSNSRNKPDKAAPAHEAAVDRHCLIPHYSSLAPFSHINYVSAEGVISFEEPSAEKDCKAVLRSFEADTRVMVPASCCGSQKEVLQYLIDCTPVFAKSNFLRVEGSKLVDALVSYEVANLVRVYKFGVIPIRVGQTIEDQWYSNEISPAFETFVSALGEKVSLNGWQMFGGGLDTVGTRTGEFSRYTTYAGLEVMFHVSPYIPTSLADPDAQRVDRKRHLGNDVVMIVFKEGATPFNPGAVFSRFNHVFIVVEPKTDSEIVGELDPAYTVTVSCKTGVPIFAPFIPTEIRRSQLRDFLLAKAVNGERAAMEAPAFHDRLSKYRQIAIELLGKNYLPKEARVPQDSPVSSPKLSSTSPPPSHTLIPQSTSVPSRHASVSPPLSAPLVPSSSWASSTDPKTPNRSPAVSLSQSRSSNSDDRLSLSAARPSGSSTSPPTPVMPPRLRIVVSPTGTEELVSEGAATHTYTTDPRKLASYADQIAQIEDLMVKARTLLGGGEANLFSIEMVLMQIHALTLPQTPRSAISTHNYTPSSTFSSQGTSFASSPSSTFSSPSSTVSLPNVHGVINSGKEEKKDAAPLGLTDGQIVRPQGRPQHGGSVVLAPSPSAPQLMFAPIHPRSRNSAPGEH